MANNYKLGALNLKYGFPAFFFLIKTHIKWAVIWDSVAIVAFGSESMCSGVLVLVVHFPVSCLPVPSRDLQVFIFMALGPL